MSGPHAYPLYVEALAGWLVIERAGDVTRVQSGPLASFDEAQAIAETLRVEHATVTPLRPVSSVRDDYRAQLGLAPEPEPDATRSAVADVLAGIADCLRALALQSDRYDDALAGLRAFDADVLDRLATVEARLDALNRLGSVKL